MVAAAQAFKRPYATNIKRLACATGLVIQVRVLRPRVLAEPSEPETSRQSRRGSRPTPRQTRPVFSAAMRVDPEPRNGSMTMSPLVGKVQQRIFEHRGRFDSRMVLKPASSVRAHRGGAGIGPDVRAPAPALAELDIVDVGSGAVLEQGQEFVL